jgi:RNA polymerase sigma-70 factor, ECF subfamily
MNDGPSAARHDEAVERLEWFEALYDAHCSRAFGLAWYLLGDGHDAEDVVQESFLAIWRSGHMPPIDEPKTLSWLLTIVRNRSIDVLRARRRRSASSLDERFDSPDGTDVQGEVAINVEREEVRQALNTLPADQREVLELAYHGGLSHHEIAERLSLPVGTVKGRIRLALNRLRTWFSAREGRERSA